MTNRKAKYASPSARTGSIFCGPDLLDWLGGYPFEVASLKHVRDFFSSRGLELLRLKDVGRRNGLNELVFLGTARSSSQAGLTGLRLLRRESLSQLCVGPGRMMRITLVITTLGRGGAERVASILASAWAAQGKQITVLTFDHGEPPAYHLHPAVQLRQLGILVTSTSILQGLRRNIARVRVLRRAIRESNPHLVISFLDRTNILTVLATRRLALPVVVVEQIDPALYDIGRIWSFLRRRIYPHADVLVCPTSRSVAKFQRMTKIRAVTIPNLIEVPAEYAVTANSRENSARRELIAMGRLDRQKGFDLLLQAFSQVAVKEPNWDLTILGGGALRATLQEQAQSLGLDQRVHFAGPIPDPFPRLHSADLFVFSSRFEGFGMALAEAMACGLPAISFDCPEGPADIIRNGVDGVLVPPEDVSALAAALDRLMSDSEERRRLASRAPEVRVRFGRERILGLWESLFAELVADSQAMNTRLPRAEATTSV